MERPRCIVVTGATGFTGRFVVRELSRTFPEATLRCLVRPASDRRRTILLAAVLVLLLLISVLFNFVFAE